MRQKQFWLSLGMIFSVLFNTLPLHSQIKSADKKQAFEITLTTNLEPKEIYRNFLRSSREGVFLPFVKMVSGKSHTENLENTLENDAVDFFEAMNVASQDSLAKVSEKAREISQKNYEKLRKNSQKVEQPRNSKSTRRGGPSFEEFDETGFFELDFEPKKTAFNFVKNSAKADQPDITKIETDTGFEFNGSQIKKTELAEASVTQSANSKSKINFDGKTTTDEVNNTQKIEIVSNVDGKKITETFDLNYKTSFDMCPDSQGYVSGKAITEISKQTIVNTGKTLIALTSEWKVEIKATAYVNDDAEMTHFDMTIDVVEKNTGFDRAKKLGLEEIDNKFQDGINQAKMQIKNNTPPSESVTERGLKVDTLPKISEIEVLNNSDITNDQAERMGKIVGVGISFAVIKFDTLMRNSIFSWQNYECVDVECTAAKNTLNPNENIDVNAVSISKQDLSKFNAKLEGNGSEQVTPKDQFGTPKAVYNLTATSDGTADIIVKSTSRRGIGLGMLEFGKSHQDDEEICDGNWQGTIAIRKSFEETFKKTTKPGEISSNLRMSGSSETINRYRYEGTVKTGSVKVATANVSLLNAKFDASAEKYFLNQGNFTETGECGWNKPTTVKVESGTELTEKSTGEGTTDITIQVDGNIYRVSVNIPKINGTYSRRVWHKPTGYCQPGNNIASDKTENDKTYFDGVGISFDGTIDPKQPDVLNGIKTITSDDGKTQTIITWRLKRCVSGKSKTKSGKR